VRAGAAAVGLAAVGALVAVPAYAGGGHVRIVQRSFDERPVVTRVAHGLGPGCPDFTGTLTERRHVTQSGFVRPGGVAHISTVVTATVTLEPARAGDVSYRGSYRSVQAGVFLHHGHLVRNASTLTVGTVRGSDGSSFGTVEVKHTSHGHTTDEFHCD
jgi:hypothetical protein